MTSLEMVKALAQLRHDASALEVVARAYDREDSAQRGEPDPWTVACDYEIEWREERLACALCALEALASYWRTLVLQGART